MLFKRKKKVLRRFSIVNLEQDAILQRRNDRTRSFDVIKVAESDEEKTVLTITEKKANKIVKCLNEIFDEMFNEQGCKYAYWLTYIEHQKGIGNCFSSFGTEGWFAKCLDEPDPFDL